jgi:hypothetical protein
MLELAISKYFLQYRLEACDASLVGTGIFKT